MKYTEITNKNQVAEKDLISLKKEYIAIVSHKLLSPLTIIKWNLELIKGGNKDCTEFKDNFDAIDMNIKKLETYSDVLMKVAEAQDLLVDEDKIELSKDKFVVDFNNILQTVKKKYKEDIDTKSLKFDINCQLKKYVVNYKKDYILEIIDSIIKNAVDYSNERTKINVECFKFDEKKKSEFELDKNSEFVGVEIENIGLEIKRDEIGLIGESFFRGDFAKKSGLKGYGLSLYLAKILIENINGKLFFKSENGITKFVAVFFVKNVYN